MTRINRACSTCMGTGYYLLDVPKGDPRYNKPQRCECQRERDLARKRDLQAVIGSWQPEMTGMTFENWQPDRFSEQWAIARAYAQRPEGWLAIYGPPGRGKTHLLAAITNAVTARGGAPLYVLTSRLLGYLREGFDSHDSANRVRLVREANPLLLDDLGAEDGTEWAQAALQDALEYRYERGLPTVIASNLKLADWPFRLASRAGDTRRSQVLRMHDPNTLDYRALPQVQQATRPGKDGK